MNILGKTLLALIAAMMVADPIMACCLPGMLDVEQTTTQSDDPPCHGAKSSAPAEQDATAPGPADMSCAGCGDCTSAMMAIDFYADVAIVTVLEDESEFALTVDSLIRATSAALPVLAIIPSGPSPRSSDTPVSLKQRLLI